jgi:hypothetical protein
MKSKEMNRKNCQMQSFMSLKMYSVTIKLYRTKKEGCSIDFMPDCLYFYEDIFMPSRLLFYVIFGFFLLLKKDMRRARWFRVI